MASTPPAAPAAPSEGAPSSSVETLPGGTIRVAPPAPQTGPDAPGTEGATPAGTEGPALPEGYDSWEAYGRDVAAGKVTPPEAKAPEEKPAEDKPLDLPPELAAKLTPYNTEVETTGTLSDESVTKAAQEFGVTEDMVRQYLAGAQASGASAVQPFHEQAGGADGYKAFQEWSVTGMTAAEQTALNKAYKGDNPEAALALQKTFVDRWKAEGNGPAPRDLTSNGGSAQGGNATDAYANWAQVQVDMNNPLYSTDSAFRSKVEEKLGRSQL